jgi:2-polyprenyl-6-methoxyphenol hydroxylase-like FAD-dependent oxidoreductase
MTIPRKPMPSILISGASIAGPTLAYWLNAAGWQTTVIERADKLRGEGQNIDIRGAAREVVRRIGIEDAIKAANTGEQGTEFLGRRGEVKARFPAGTSDTAGATAELEILRGELSQIITDRTTPATEYLFGNKITGLAQDADGVTVSFDEGDDRRFDLVVLAEGMRSRTRALVFGEEPQIRDLGMYTAYFTIPRTSTDTDWWRWYNATGGRNVSLRPDNLGTIRATLSFLSEPRGYDELTVPEQKQVLRRRFGDVGWEAPRVLAALDDTELYFEALGQVRAPVWHRGRVALLGDAAYCASPISGMGTSLALVGAYVLAGELAASPSPEEAFSNYEKIMRPYVDQAQKLPPGAPRIANPKSRAGIAVFHTGVALAARIGRLGLADRLFAPPADKIDLPHY